jgi:hypothetical protein
MRRIASMFGLKLFSSRLTAGEKSYYPLRGAKQIQFSGSANASASPHPREINGEEGFNFLQNTLTKPQLFKT